MRVSTRVARQMLACGVVAGAGAVLSRTAETLGVAWRWCGLGRCEASSGVRQAALRRSRCGRRRSLDGGAKPSWQPAKMVPQVLTGWGVALAGRGRAGRAGMAQLLLCGRCCVLSSVAQPSCCSGILAWRVLRPEQLASGARASLPPRAQASAGGSLSERSSAGAHVRPSPPPSDSRRSLAGQTHELRLIQLASDAARARLSSPASSPAG